MEAEDEVSVQIKMETTAPKAAEPRHGWGENVLSCCCCLKTFPREVINEVILGNDAGTQEQSVFQRLCFCYCYPKARVNNGIEQIPELKGLAGLMIQDGDHVTAGSLTFLKYAKWDAETRIAYMPVFSGFGWWHGGTTGLWTEPAYTAWCCIMNVARLANYTYRFSFSEDYMHGDIDVLVNPCCCCGCVCLPAWFTLPRCLNHFTFEQDLGSKDGTEWTRYNAKCMGEAKPYYKLLQVWQPDGRQGKHFDRLQIAPQQVMITY
eukprot:TRINITY_DN48061_c0_g1_i1.p1 TRINITY_DN48061_c0_g1~~TRINITY_DN48061_c0_g1_i1.p1  ORF type:complete len:288 (+),score=45.14 TRINITY_DN48061_c0_g1_i1:77-865(+)